MIHVRFSFQVCREAEKAVEEKSDKKTDKKEHNDIDAKPKPDRIATPDSSPERINGLADLTPSEVDKTSPQPDKTTPTTDKSSPKTDKISSAIKKAADVKRFSVETNDVKPSPENKKLDVNKSSKTSPENVKVSTDVRIKSDVKPGTDPKTPEKQDSKSKVEVRKSADDIRLENRKDINRRSDIIRNDISKSSVEINKSEVRAEIRAITDLIKGDRKERSRSSSTEIDTKRVSAEVSKIESRSRSMGSMDDKDRYSVEVRRSKDYSSSGSIEEVESDSKEKTPSAVEIRSVTVSRNF